MTSATLPRAVLPARGEPGAEASSGRVALTNALLRGAWSRGWARPIVFDPEHLLTTARTRTGLAEFGPDTGWRSRLDLLADSLETQAALTPLGRTIAHGQLVGALANRLRMHALWQRHPDILDQPLPAPVIVLGQMRSGSTRMQRLLACDPRLSFTRFFESWNPLPSRRVDDRRVRGWLGLACARAINPAFGAIHPTSATQADEEIGLHSVSLFGSVFEAQWRVPAFAAECERINTRPVYAEFRRLLQTLAWLRRERGDRPQVIKVPQLSQDLAAVLDVFPDARLVCLRRDPAKLVASAASLVHNQMALQSDAADRHWIGREWLRKVALRERRTADARTRADVMQVDVAFDAMNADWEGEMRRVYAVLGIPLTAAVRDAMAAYLAQPTHRALARHRYSLAEFGLSEADVRAAVGRCGQ